MIHPKALPKDTSLDKQLEILISLLFLTKGSLA